MKLKAFQKIDHLMSTGLLYICYEDSPNSDEDGCAIYDRRTIAAFRRCGIDVEVLSIPRTRTLGLPTWVCSIPPDAKEYIALFRKKRRKILVSHEGLFDAAGRDSVDVIIVHNYFPAFYFPTQRILMAYYRIRALPYFATHFKLAKTVVFLSYRDFSRAKATFPEIDRKSIVLPPPPLESKRLARRMDLIHVSGTTKWLPKRLSRVTVSDYDKMRRLGFSVQDFGIETYPAFGLINDRFSVGFKLKLMQMIYSRDVIGAVCGIAEEIESVAPGYPFYRQIRNVSEAIDYFSSVAHEMSAAEIDEVFDIKLSNLCIATWDDLALSMAAATDNEQLKSTFIA